MKLYICFFLLCAVLMLCIHALREHYTETEKNKSGRIAVIMVNINDSRGKYSVPLWKKYCKKWGYTFIQLTENTYFDQDMHLAWAKIPFILQVMKEKQFQYIMHIDADTLPLHMDMSITMFTQMHNNSNKSAQMWFSKDAPSMNGGYTFDSLNTGVMIFNVNDNVVTFFEKVWEKRDKTALDWPWEQGAIEETLEDIFQQKETFLDKENIVVIEYGDWQTFGDSDACQVNNILECKDTQKAWIMHLVSGMHGTNGEGDHVDAFETIWEREFEHKHQETQLY